MRCVLAVVTTGLTAVGGSAAAAPAAAPAASGPTHGVVGTTCDAARVGPDKAAGVAVVVFGARWDLLIPQQGTVDLYYKGLLADRLRNCAAAGLRVIIDSGVQFAPGWVRALPNAMLLDQYGKPSTVGGLDLVFNANVRTAVAIYLRELVSALPPYTVEGIRVGTSVSGELGYPGPSDGGSLDSWWAFGPAPQSGTGLTPGQNVSPLPGWVPGQSTWRGQPVTPLQALTWFRWYDRSVAQAVWYQARVLADAGFAGTVHLPAAGSGVLPADLNTAVNAILAGAVDRDGSLRRGLDYVDQFPALAGVLPNLVIDLTSVDDASAPPARALTPPQDQCTNGDATASVNLSVNVAAWPRLRFARAQVARAGLAAVGENPGPPSALTGGVAGSDSEKEQLTRSPGYARSCALAALQFGFEDDLFTGRSGITLEDYANAW